MVTGVTTQKTAPLSLPQFAHEVDMCIRCGIAAVDTHIADAELISTP